MYEFVKKERTAAIFIFLFTIFFSFSFKFTLSLSKNFKNNFSELIIASNSKYCLKNKEKNKLIKQIIINMLLSTLLKNKEIIKESATHKK